MTNPFELQPVRGIGTIAWQQFRLLGWSNRWLYLTGALIALLMLSSLAPVPPWPRPIVIALVSLPVGVLWAMAVWQNETPTGRLFHWSLPVSRPLSDLSRILAGAAFLILSYVALLGAGAIWAAGEGTLSRYAATGATSWLNYFLAPLIVYLLVMPLVLWSEYRVTKWFMAGLFLFPPFMTLLDALGSTMLSEAFVTAMVGGDLSLASALFDPMLGDVEPDWWLAATLWLAVGAVLTTFAATFRPDDLRWLARRRARG